MTRTSPHVKGAKPDASVDSPSTSSGIIRKVLTSESFVEKFTLLALTVILSGILVPRIFAYFDARSVERQKTIEVMRLKNEAILQAQSKLLDEFSETALAYQTLALDVSWFKTRGVKNEALHEAAYKRYSERVVDLISKWRALASRAQTLASPEVSDKIDGFLVRVFSEQDTPMNVLHQNQARDEEWEAQHRDNVQMLIETNKLIAEIANDLGLAKKNLDQ